MPCGTPGTKTWSGTSFPEKTQPLTSPVTLSWSTSVKLRPAACWPWRTTLILRGWHHSAKCSACSNMSRVSLTVWCCCVGEKNRSVSASCYFHFEPRNLNLCPSITVDRVSLCLCSQRMPLCPHCLWCQRGLYIFMWNAGQLLGLDAWQGVCMCVCAVWGDGRKDRERLCLLTVGGSRWLRVVGLAWTQGFWGGLGRGNALDLAWDERAQWAPSLDTRVVSVWRQRETCETAKQGGGLCVFNPSDLICNQECLD